MGARAETWPKERLAGMAAFFSQVGYKATARVERGDRLLRSRTRRRGRRAAASLFPTARPRGSRRTRTRARSFADWLIAPENPWFARNVVNRVWSWLLGRGIVHEPDDIRPDNPP